MQRSRPTLILVAVTLLALALGARLFCGAPESADATRDDRPTEESAPRPTADLELDAEPDPPKSRAQVDGPVAEDPAAAIREPEPGPYAFSIDGLLVNRVEQPLGGATVYLAPRGLPLQRVGQTSADGRFALRWSGHRDRVEIALHLLTGHEAGTRARTFEVVAGRPLRLRLVTSFQPDPAGLTRITPEEFDELALQPGEVPSDEEPDEIEEELGWPNGIAAEVSDAPDEGRSGDEPILFVDDADRSACPDSGLAVGPVLTAARFLQPSAVVYESTVSFDDSEHHHGPVPQGRIDVRVVAESGAPVRRARATLFSDEGHFLSRQKSDDDGRLAFDRMEGGRYRVEVFAGPAGRASVSVDLEPDQAFRWTAQLERGLVVEGRIVDADGEPLRSATVRVEKATADELWVSETWSESDGSFCFTGCPPGALRLLVRRRGSEAALFERTVEPVFGEDLPLPTELEELREIAVDPPPTSTLSVQVLDEDGAPAMHARARAWRVETGRGVRLPLADRSGTYTAVGLPPGLYRVEAGARSHPWQDLGQHLVAAGADLSLGAVTLGAPVAVDFEVEGHVRAIEIWREAAGLPIRSRRVEGATPPALELPPGEYTVEVWGPFGSTRRPLDLSDSERRLVRLLDVDGALGVELAKGPAGPRPNQGCTACHAGEPKR